MYTSRNKKIVKSKMLGFLYKYNIRILNSWDFSINENKIKIPYIWEFKLEIIERP